MNDPTRRGLQGGNDTLQEIREKTKEIAELLNWPRFNDIVENVIFSINYPELYERDSQVKKHRKEE